MSVQIHTDQAEAFSEVYTYVEALADEHATWVLIDPKRGPITMSETDLAIANQEGALHGHAVDALMVIEGARGGVLVAAYDDGTRRNVMADHVVVPRALYDEHAPQLVEGALFGLSGKHDTLVSSSIGEIADTDSLDAWLGGAQ